jgi:putative DNA primase/helicase
MSLDFAGINRRLLASSETFISSWLPGGKLDGRNWIVRNPMRDDAHPSLKVHVDEGNWKDFGNGDGGADLISLYAYLFTGSNQGEAARALAAELGMNGTPAAAPRRGQEAPPAEGSTKPKKAGRPKWTAVIPARPEGKLLPSHRRYGLSSGQWAYHTREGALIGYVLRFDPPFPGDPEAKRKVFSPVVWARSDWGKEDWSFQGFPKPWPLYNLHLLAQRPHDPVLVCEGESSADAGGRLLPEYVATTALHGAESPEHSDWSEISNREVLIWPDNDEGGQKYASFVARKLKGQGCRVRILKIPEEWPRKYDAKNFEQDGRQLADLRKLIEVLPEYGAELLPAGTGQSPIIEGDEPWPIATCGEFTIDTEGVWRDMGKNRALDRITLRPIWVEAITENLYGAAGLMVKFYDQRWRLREYAFPLGRLSESGGVLGQELLTQMFLVVSGKEKWLSRYLAFQAEACTKLFRSVHRMGWVDSLGAPVFMLPQQVMGSPDVPLVYQPVDLSSLMDCISARGDMAGWKKHVADQARGNPFLMFGIMMGLASALLKPANVEMGGFHFYGLTTGGKTTLLQVAASVWGCGADPQMGPEETSVRKWHSTAAGFESTAEAHNDTLLCLDELEQAPEEELGRIVFLLAGGLSKSRSTAGGGLRAVKTWRVMICSSGEKSIRHQMGQAGKEYKGGKAVRLADIPVDGDDGQRSIFAECHGLPPEVFGDHLKIACAEHFGLAGPTFVAAMIAEAMRQGWLPFCRQLREALQQCKAELGKVDHGLPPESARVLTRFALVALAGRLAATSWIGVLDWPLDEVLHAVRFVRDRWLANLGEERSEQERALAHLRDAIVREESRIIWLAVIKSENSFFPDRIDRDKSSSRIGQVRNVIGFRVPEEYGFLPGGFREICGEYDPKMVLNSLKAAGFLNHDEGKHTRKWPTIPGYKRPYLYSIKASFLGDDEEEVPPAAGGACPF